MGLRSTRLVPQNTPILQTPIASPRCYMCFWLIGGLQDLLEQLPEQKISVTRLLAYYKVYSRTTKAKWIDTYIRKDPDHRSFYPLECGVCHPPGTRTLLVRQPGRSINPVLLRFLWRLKYGGMLIKSLTFSDWFNLQPLSLSGRSGVGLKVPIF